MNHSQLRREKDVAAARQIAPISNWVKPSRAPVTLANFGDNPNLRIAQLEAQLAQEQREKMQLQRLNASLADRLHTALQRIKTFLKDET